MEEIKKQKYADILKEGLQGMFDQLCEDLKIDKITVEDLGIRVLEEDRIRFEENRVMTKMSLFMVLSE